MDPEEREAFDNARAKWMVEKQREIEQLRLEIMQKDKTIEDLILLTEVKN